MRSAPDGGCALVVELPVPQAGRSDEKRVPRFEGRLDGDRGVLQGKHGGRDGTLTLARAAN